MLAWPEPYGTGLAPSYFLAPKSNQKPLGGFKCEAMITLCIARQGAISPPNPRCCKPNDVLKKIKKR